MVIKMKAIQLIAKNKATELCEVPIPKIVDPNDVLIKVAYSGICGTDLHMIQGKFPTAQDHPVILGHEFSGTIADIGKNVTKFQKGDRVAADPNDSCLRCEWCQLGKPHFCVDITKNLGSFKHGGWAEFVVVPASMVHKLPRDITLKQGALAEPLSCLSHGLDLIEPMPIGSSILITGAGIIGVLWASICHLRGQRNVTICEPNSARLEVVKKLDLGFDLMTPVQLKECYKDSGYVFDFIIDCSGYAPIVEYSINLLKKCGTILCFGVAPPEAEIKINPYIMFWREITILGAKVNPFSFPKAVRMIEAMSDRYLQYDKLGIKIYKLEEYETALNELKRGSVLKAVFEL